MGDETPIIESNRVFEWSDGNKTVVRSLYVDEDGETQVVVKESPQKERRTLHIEDIRARLVDDEGAAVAEVCE
jgi:hypothetical protein